MKKALTIAAVAAVLATSSFGFGLQNNIAAPQQTHQQVVAQGAYGTMSLDAFNAYMEALTFCMQQIGQPTQYTAAQREQMKMAFKQGFAALDPETQQQLGDARNIWTQYQNGWNTLSMDQKKEFAFGVLMLAYGEQAAAQALGLNQSGGGTVPGYNPSASDLNAQSHLNSGGIDAGDGTYEYYNPSTGRYDYQ